MPNNDANSAHLQEVNEEIYKRNLELAVVNKTLSLLRKLYQISLLSLDPAAISEKISETVRVDLNMEVVGVFLYEKEKDELIPFKFSYSDRFSAAFRRLKLDQIQFQQAAKTGFLKDILTSPQMQTIDDIGLIWAGKVDEGELKKISDQSHLKTAILYPLITGDRVIGLLLLGINRSYESLSHFEKDSINSFNDVVAVALDKALLYKQLQIANEQLRALDKARAEFISIASHQLRTPPATIKWYINAVLSGDFGKIADDMKAALERINVTNNAQIATIDDLLNASRIERGKLEFFFEKASLEPIVSDLAMQLRPLAGMKKLSLEYAPPKSPLPELVMDKEKIRQVINNMIDNAIKYSKQGSIKVSLAQEDQNLVVRVEDNGKGISPAEVNTVFDKYSRGHDSATHATGLGLGMYVAKIIIEQHHGKIWAESPGEGKGSTFIFSLPIHSELKATTIDLVAEQGSPAA